MPVAADCYHFWSQCYVESEEKQRVQYFWKTIYKTFTLSIQTHQKLHHTFQKCVRLHVRKDHFKTHKCKKGVVICKTLVPANDGYNNVFNCCNMESNALLDGCNKQSNKLVDAAYTASFSDAFQIADQHSLSSLSTTFNGRSAIN